ncbi:MAG: TolC family protein [Acidobacteria bacterium]|nr:TolC family protein [Acidobacteriota bacterium]
MILKGTVLFLALIVVLKSGLSQSMPQQLGLNECLERASSGHPLIAAAQARMQGAEESRKYIGARPNPTFTVQTENWRSWQQPAFSFGRDIDIFLYGTQRLETAGKAVRRRELADQQALVTRSEIDVVRLQLRREVARTYWVALQAQTILEIITENRHDLDKLVQYTDLRVREGYAAESELIRAKLEQQTFIGQEASAALSLERAKLDLLKSMGETRFDTHFRLADSDFSGPQTSAAELEHLRSEALAKRPELSLLRVRIDAERANLRLQQASATPDFEISAGYKRTGGFDTMIGYVTIPLPIFNRNRAEIGRASARVTSAEQELLGEENYVRAEVEAAYRAAKRLEARLKELQRDFLKQADESGNIALVAYREGAADLYKLLETQRARNEARLLYFRTLNEYQQALMELNLAIGREGER